MVDLDKISAFYENKTFKYLSHTLRWYGDSFIQALGKFGKVRYMGIDDENIVSYNEPVIFLVFKLQGLKLNEFKNSLNILKTYKGYLDNYHLGDITSHYHVFVIKIPEQGHLAYERFLLSKYSEMYTKREIEHLFKIHSYNNTISLYIHKWNEMVIAANNVCIKAAHVKLELEKKISGATGWVSLPENAEYDECIYPENEILNYKNCNRLWTPKTLKNLNKSYNL